MDELTVFGRRLREVRCWRQLTLREAADLAGLSFSFWGQAHGMLHLSAALAAAAQTDHDTAATHLDEASALAARMDTEVGTWAHLWFGSTTVGIWKTSIALDELSPTKSV